MSQWVGVAVLVAGAVIAGVLFGGSPDPPPVVAIEAQAATGTLTVHITGAVRRPGLVEVVAGSRVADVVAAAGGLAPGARLQGLNLAAPARDGSQIIVPLQSSDSATAGPVSMSLATESELSSLPGVGPVLAQRIVAHRLQHGPFQTMEDLLDVPGIGEAKLAALRDAAVP